MSLEAALNALAALPVPGVSAYGVGALPPTLERGTLPALVVLPLSLPELPLLPSAGLGLGTFAQGSAYAQISVTHLLLWTTREAAQPLRLTLPALIASVDDVLSAYAADPLLGDALAEPTQVRVELGQFRWSTSEYYGCAFRHVWLLRL